MTTLAVTLVDFSKTAAPCVPLEVDRLHDKETPMLRHVLLVEIVTSSDEIAKRRNVEASSLEVEGSLPFGKPTPMSMHVVDYRGELFKILHRLDGGTQPEIGNARLLIGGEQITDSMLAALQHAIVRTSADIYSLKNAAGLAPLPPVFIHSALQRLLQFVNKAVELGQPK